ncbi:MYND-type domain-containing protein [Mycena chlorophos]|uniref:MYND-type domain-containing protein n=1 Tax=Mycena chlorophos TaxID=658473 RepID=A0A8H6SB94_MYCCL|nr:MYND-type domain-containing protein [Mycena chlorophos]
MHSAFKLEALHRLPISDKKLALAVCRPTCGADSEDLSSLERIWETRSDLRSFLPVFHHFLQPSRLPNEEDLSEPSQDTIFALRLAFFALMYVQKVQAVPRGAELEAWRLVFPWIMLCLTMDESLPPASEPLPLVFVLEAFANFTMQVIPIGQHETNVRLRAQLAEIPGFYIYNYRAWKMTLESDLREPRYRITRLLGIFHTLSDYCRKTPDQFEEIVFGCGGAVDDVARLFERHLTWAVSLLEKPAQLFPDAIDHDITHLVNGLNIVVRSIVCSEAMAAQNGVPSPETQLHTTLAARRFSRVLMRVFRFVVFNGLGRGRDLSLDSQHPHIIESLIRNPLLILVGMMKTSGISPLILAVRHGLIEGLAALCMGTSSVKVTKQRATEVREFIERDLIPHLIFPTVLTAVVPKIELFSKQEISNTSLKSTWLKLVENSRINAELYRAFKSREVVLKSCDNLRVGPCQKICPRNHFKSCAGCSSMIYCSPTCQKEDWRAGHRKMCTTYNTSRLANPLNHHQEGFIRFVLSKKLDVPSQLPTIVFHHAIGSRPGMRIPFLTLTGVEQSAVQYLERAELPAVTEAGDNDPTRLDQIRRVEESGGKMILCVVEIAFADDEINKLVPIHMSDAVATNVAQQIIRERFPELLVEEATGRSERALQRQFHQFERLFQGAVALPDDFTWTT